MNSHPNDIGPHDEIILSREVSGPTGPISQRIVRRPYENDRTDWCAWDVYVSTHTGGGYSMLGRYSEAEARQTVDQCTRTLRVCQLWDSAPGLQWKSESDWSEALDRWLASAAA